jgi:hypothetical protein
VRVKAIPAGPKTAECSRKLNLLHGTSMTNMNKAPRSFRCTDERERPGGSVREAKSLTMSANCCLFFFFFFWLCVLPYYLPNCRPVVRGCGGTLV